MGNGDLTPTLEPEPCTTCPEHGEPVFERRFSRRRVLLGGMAAGVGLFLTKFLPPLPGLREFLPSVPVAHADCPTCPS